MKIFIDTSAFLSLLILNETTHERVADKYKSYTLQRALLFTSHYVLDELYTRLLYDFGKKVTKGAIDHVKQSIHSNDLNLLFVDDVIFEKTQTEFLRFSEHALSFTDASSYVLCKEFALDEVFTLDSDFKKIGVKTSF